jgi:hypothetical protein
MILPGYHINDKIANGMSMGTAFYFESKAISIGIQANCSEFKFCRRRTTQATVVTGPIDGYSRRGAQGRSTSSRVGTGFVNKAMSSDRTKYTLPPLRLILRPQIGFGVDVSMRIARGFNCFMAAEAFVNGKSSVQFGLQPRFASWFRFVLAPSCHLSLRIPTLRLSECKILYVGGSATFADEGKLNPILTSPVDVPFWKSACQILVPALEIQHHASILSAFLDDHTRRTLRNSLKEFHANRHRGKEQLQNDRRRLLRTFEPNQLPPLDPRGKGTQGSEDADAPLEHEAYPPSIMQERIRRTRDGLAPPGSGRNQSRSIMRDKFTGFVSNQVWRIHAGYITAHRLPMRVHLGETASSRDIDIR